MPRRSEISASGPARARSVGPPPYDGTRLRNVRVDDELWLAGLAATAAHGTSCAKVMRDALAEYVATHPVPECGTPEEEQDDDERTA